MNHNLTIGHMDTALVAERGAKVLRPIDDRLVERHLKTLGTREEDRWTLGGRRVEFRNGCIIVGWWVGADRNRVAEEFALRLQRETGCQMIDREHGRSNRAGATGGADCERFEGGYKLTSAFPERHNSGSSPPESESMGFSLALRGIFASRESAPPESVGSFDRTAESAEVHAHRSG